MKKILLIALTLLVTGSVYADKKCCKSKASCKKEASCNKSETKHSQLSNPAVNDDGTVVVNAEGKASGTEGTHACCKRSIAAGNKACCAKTVATPTKDAQKAAPVRDDAK